MSRIWNQILCINLGPVQEGVMLQKITEQIQPDMIWKFHHNEYTPVFILLQQLPFLPICYYPHVPSTPSTCSCGAHEQHQAFEIQPEPLVSNNFLCLCRVSDWVIQIWTHRSRVTPRAGLSAMDLILWRPWRYLTPTCVVCVHTEYTKH